MATLNKLACTIGAGQFLSGAVELADNFVVGIIMPDEWDAARVTILVSTDGLNYYSLYSFGEDSTSATEVKFNVMESAMIAVDPHTMLMAKYLKLQSGTRDEPVEQDAVRTFFIVTVNSIAI